MTLKLTKNNTMNGDTKITIDFSKCRLHKEHDNGLVITGSKPRYNKRGDFGTDSIFLAYKVIEIVSHKKNEIGSTSELIVKMPRWLFDSRIEGKKDIVNRIKIINLEE
jgi:hypothetical protein